MLQPSPMSTTLAFSSRVVTSCIVAAILSISALVITVAVVGFPGLGWAPAATGIRTAAVSKPVNAVLFIGAPPEHVEGRLLHRRSRIQPLVTASICRRGAGSTRASRLGDGGGKSRRARAHLVNLSVTD